MIANRDKNEKLPLGWVQVKIGDVLPIIRGASPRPKGDSRYFGGNIPWIKISDITKEKGKYISTTRDHVTEEGAKKSRYLEAGTLILSNSGTVCVPKILAVDGCIHDGFIAFPELPGEFNILYLYHFFDKIRPQIINENRQGITQVNLNTTIVKNIDLPVAPPKEQNRVVAEIEKQFYRLDEAVANLKRIKTNLKRYKASVLKAAVEGRLTEKWRKANPDVEPADRLLERILVQRRRKWEESELAKMKVKGKEPKDDKWKKKYKEPYQPVLSNLPKVPLTWEWGTFEQVSTRVTVGHVGSMKNEYQDSGIPFLRSQNVRENKFSPIGLKFINRSFHEKLKKSSLKSGDIVVVRSGNVGITCVIPPTLSESNCSDLVIIKNPLAVLPEYGSYYMNSITTTRVASEKVGIALTHFNTKSVASMPIPVPPLDEQTKIIFEVEKRLSVIDEIEKNVERDFLKANRLRQSILKKAFAGKLVPQINNGESPEILQK